MRAFTIVSVLVLLAGCVSHEDRGDHYAERGDWDSALASYERAVADDPDEPALERKRANALERARAAHLATARAERAAGKLDAAIDAMRRALELASPAERDALNAELAEYSRERARREALAHLAEASVHLAGARLSAAEGSARAAVASDPTTAEAPAMLERIAQAQGAAKPALERALAMGRTSDHVGALAAHQEALVAWRDHPELLAGAARAVAHLEHDRFLALAQQHAAAGDFAGAVAAAEAARGRVDSPAVRELLGRIAPLAQARELATAGSRALEAADLGAAEASFVRALELDPRLSELHPLLATVQERRRAAEARFADAERLASEGRWAEAAAAHAEVLALWSTHPGSLAGRERSLAELERRTHIAHALERMAERQWPAALAELDRARTHGDDPQIDVLAAQCRACEQADRALAVAEQRRVEHALTGALAALEDARRLEPGHPGLPGLARRLEHEIHHLEHILAEARAEHGHGHFAAAIPLYEQVLAGWVDNASATDGLERARRSAPLP